MTFSECHQPFVKFHKLFQVSLGTQSMLFPTQWRGLAQISLKHSLSTPTSIRQSVVNLQCYPNHQTPHTYLSSPNKKVLHLVTIQVPGLVLLVLLGGTPNFQYLTDLNPKQSNPTNKETTTLKNPLRELQTLVPTFSWGTKYSCVTWPTHLVMSRSQRGRGFVVGWGRRRGAVTVTAIT